MTTILWFKALHIAFMVAWFAGIFYLPRLFVYHAENKDSHTNEIFKTMERRLLYFVTPWAILTLIFGVALIGHYGLDWFKHSAWLHAKLTFVVGLYIYHAYCFKLLNDFKNDRNTKSAKFYRWFNEIPVIALFAIIILAVVKPF
ncbi:protoporphyrinogen oxidase HemJ [Saccharobesus litoralis]|uniref:Protoporphyrinogen IX oxidase n=1 Tax=Saccharobesus litoralis TaxID=2172099 RepID=A0A2S0VS20_9ALTE|nr:protoporphyrinogen oxidase HemJ [Saccharobesus litoralis]AWB67007.1 protoporphyrinogen oxidase HemJ [Saccharobesus litoralis]